MNQIVLSEGAAAELSEIDKLEQLEIVSEFSKVRKEPLQSGQNPFNEIKRGGRTVYRHRYKDYRIYFEKQGDQLIVHHVLHGNSLRDFFVRSNLDVQNDEEFEKSAKFWKFIEQKKLKLQSSE